MPPGVSPANAILSSPLMHLGGGMGHDGMGMGGEHGGKGSHGGKGEHGRMGNHS